MLQAVHGWFSTYERLVKSQKFFSSYLTQEDLSGFGSGPVRTGAHLIGPGGGRGIGELAAQSTAALVLYLYNSIPARPADAVRHESTCAQFWIILPFLL